MAHLIETMAFVRQTPWHGLGTRLPPHQSIEAWQQAAGMDWALQSAPVLYAVGDGEARQVKVNPEAQVLFRSDTQMPLSVVSQRYQPVQPREVLAFYRDLVAAGGFELETAGVLKGGKKLWALARTGQAAVLQGGDQVKAYLLLATSCDGSLATTAQFTSVRVVCNNTLQLALGRQACAVKVPHSTRFDPALVKRELGLGLSAWDAFLASIQAMAACPVDQDTARHFLGAVLGDPAQPAATLPRLRSVESVLALFEGQGMGAALPSARQTVWGLLNATTEFVDHHRRARSQDHRLDAAWFGAGAAIKAKALAAAHQLVQA